MTRLPPRSNRTDPPFPYTTLVRSLADLVQELRALVPEFADDETPHHDAARQDDPHRGGQMIDLFAGRSVILGDQAADRHPGEIVRSEEHTSELQSLMRISYAVFCLKKKK